MIKNKSDPDYIFCSWMKIVVVDCFCLITQLPFFVFFEAVAAVGDGLKAWELLKGRPRNIDLILTEVDLPSISGYALLTLIMEHEACKNIPVISTIHMNFFYIFNVVRIPIV